MTNTLAEILPVSTFGILLTLFAYLAGLWLYRRSGGHAALQPVITGVLIIIGVLLVLNIPYKTYFASAEIIHTLLGTATVALAIPLYQNLARIRANWLPLTVTLLSGGIVAAITAVGVAWVLGADERILLSLAPKSITTPFAIAVSEIIGGYPALSAAFVIFTGMVAAMCAPPLFRLLGVDSPVAQGTALGMIGHGIGTARAFELGSETGAFSALSMGLMGVYTSLSLPWIVHAFF